MRKRWSAVVSESLKRSRKRASSVGLSGSLRQASRTSSSASSVSPSARKASASASLPEGVCGLSRAKKARTKGAGLRSARSASSLRRRIQAGFG